MAEITCAFPLPPLSAGHQLQAKMRVLDRVRRSTSSIPNQDVRDHKSKQKASIELVEPSAQGLLSLILSHAVKQLRDEQ